MARRKELKNIASGLLGAFVSRNNDVGGYWGIGHLCSLATNSQSAKVKLDILAKTMFPACSTFDKLLSGYSSRLAHQMNARCLPIAWITNSTIELDFNAELPDDRRVPISTRGGLFSVTVTIVDDRSKAHSVKAYGYCAPHNATKEYKSAGPERY